VLRLLSECRSRLLAQRLAVALLGAAGVLAFVASDAHAGSKPAVYTVVIQGVKFEPETLTVKRGDVVVWVNRDPFPHTVTAPAAFDSRSIAAGRSWKYVARKVGQDAYTCTLHPNMKGTLRVE
jgi:plastocyanin